MTVFTNRVRRAYVRRRSAGEMAVLTVVMVAVMAVPVALFGLAGYLDRRDQEALAAFAAEQSEQLGSNVIVGVRNGEPQLMRVAPGEGR